MLADYVQSGSDAAFRELVTRYVDLVYSTALRLVDGDRHRAEDVAQIVFVNLARTARTLPGEVKLGGWLHRHTCFVAANTMRGERRRQSRERQAVEMNALQDNSEANFSLIGPILDEAINELGEADRTAILLRFFEHQDFRSVGAAVGSTEDAARMRVTRALEKLQELLLRHGVTTSAGALSVALSAHVVQAAPAGLAITISTAAVLAETALTTTATATATKTIVMTTLQKSLIAATLVVAVGTGIYEARQASTARDRADLLHQQQATLNEQIQQLTRERDEAARKLTASPADAERLNRSTEELRKLRGEVTRLRAAASPAQNDPTEVAMKSWLNRVSSLKQRLAQSPEAAIPELQLLGESDWLSVVKDRSLDSDEDYRKALSALRGAGEHKLVPLLQDALRKFAHANNSKYPTDLSQLRPYFENPAVDDAMLRRYEIVPQDTIREVRVGEEWVITQKTAVDDEHDNKFVIGSRGYGSTTFTPRIVEGDGQEPLLLTLVPAAVAFQKANPGQESKEFSDLAPYVKTAAQLAALQTLNEATEAFKRANNGQSPKGFPDLKPYLKSETKRAQ